MSAELERARSIARAVINDFGIDDPREIDIAAIAFSKGVLVREVTLSGSAARLVRQGPLGLITVNDAIREEGQKRFGIAHELGHFDLHEHTSQLAACTEEMMLTYRTGIEEPEANAYASELLMPEPLFLRQMKGSPSLSQVLELASLFRTSVTSTAFRFCDLTEEPCAVVVSRNSDVHRVFKNDDFPYWIEGGVQVHADTYAADAFSGKPLPEEMRPVPLQAWVEDDVPRDALIKEQTLYMSSYRAALSFLWLEEPVDEDL